MPKQTAKSGLAAKLGDKGRKAFDRHKADETNYGAGADLPAGIEAGIAQLVDCKFDTYKRGDNQGELYFYAAGVVKEPETFNGQHIAGLRTQIGPEPLCETPRRSRQTVEDHIDWILNEFRKLGVDTSEHDLDDLEDVAAALVEDKPHFRFRTWQGQATEQFPNPRVNHDWRGACDYDEGDSTDDVVETSEYDLDNLGHVTATLMEDQEEPEPIVKSKAIPSDLDELAQNADAGDEASAEKLTDLAAKAGLDNSAVEDAESWESVVGMLREADLDEDNEDKEEGEEQQSEAETYVPEKGHIVFYKPPKKRKAIEVEVTAVFASKETCNVKDLADGKSYKAVPWSKLEEAE